MTPEQFTTALGALNWKQTDFCRKTGVHKSTPTNWVTGKTPIPLWVDAYLGAMLDLAALHGKYLVVADARPHTPGEARQAVANTMRALARGEISAADVMKEAKNLNAITKAMKRKASTE